MKFFVGTVVTLCILQVHSFASTQQGQAIFDTKGCTLCHKKDVDTIGPSIQTIAIGYTGKETALITYLQGQSDAIIDADRASVMKPQLIKIRTLFEEDLRSLAEYIISISDRPF